MKFFLKKAPKLLASH